MSASGHQEQQQHRGGGQGHAVPFRGEVGAAAQRPARQPDQQQLHSGSSRQARLYATIRRDFHARGFQRTNDRGHRAAAHGAFTPFKPADRSDRDLRGIGQIINLQSRERAGRPQLCRRHFCLSPLDLPVAPNIACAYITCQHQMRLQPTFGLTGKQNALQHCILARTSKKATAMNTSQETMINSRLRCAQTVGELTTTFHRFDAERFRWLEAQLLAAGCGEAARLAGDWATEHELTARKIAESKRGMEARGAA